MKNYTTIGRYSVIKTEGLTYVRAILILCFTWFLAGSYHSLKAQTLYTNGSSGTSTTQNSAVNIAGLLTIGTGATQLTAATVSISNNFVTGQDELGINGSTSGTDGSITYSYNATSGVLSLTGTVTAANYQTTLRKVTYKNTAASPNTSIRTVSFSLNAALPFSGTGHYYEYVSGNTTWSNANTAANARTYFGLTGYLVTVTSANENAFCASKIGANACWAGGTAASGTGAEWRWSSGPEAGVQFWSGVDFGNSYNGQYANWNTNEPNSGLHGEDYVQFLPTSGLWNNLNGTASINGYVVEYGGTSGDPVLHISDNVFVNFTMPYPGNTIDFDGVNDFVSINDAANLNPGAQNLTVECWFNATTTGSGEHHLFNKEDLYEASIIDGYFRFALMPNWVWQGGNSFPVTAGQWYHIAVVYDHTNITIYKNGQLFSTLAKTNDIGTNTTKLLIGARGDVTPSAFFNGKIDELRVWNTARTACEINSNMANSLLGNETGLVALYNFDNGTAGSVNTGITSLPDLAGGDNTGTLTNLALTGATSNWVTSQAGLGLPAITTTGSANITAVTADVSGNITAIGAANPTIIGVCYNTTGCPTVNDPKTETTGSYGTGTFTMAISGLSGSTLYYARAYASNTSGTSYGSQISFTTLAVPANPGSITSTYNIICNGASTQLTAAGVVGTVYWYTGSCGGTLVTTGNPATVSPSANTVYYCRNYNNSSFSPGCASITITVNPRPTVANLVATGTGIQWYSAASGGTALATSTLLVNGTHYYASQTVNGVESTNRLDVLVTMSNP